MDDIAERAGIAKGTLYLYYHSKHDIFLAALVQGSASSARTPPKKVEAATGVLGKIEAFVRTRVEYFETTATLPHLPLSRSGTCSCIPPSRPARAPKCISIRRGCSKRY